MFAMNVVEETWQQFPAVDVLGQVWYLIYRFPNFCLLSYFGLKIFVSGEYSIILPLDYLLLGHLLSGSILNHLMHSKDAESRCNVKRCICYLGEAGAPLNQFTPSSKIFY